MLDKDSKIPIHQQLYLILKEKITGGEYQPNDRIPSESEFQVEYGVSRVTIRRAITDLENDGFVKKKRGSGTVVIPQNKYEETFAFRGFTEDVVAHGSIPSSIILDCSEIAASVKVSEMLQVEPGELIGHLKRLRLVDGRVKALHETFISLRHGFRINEKSFNATTSLYDFYKEHGVELGYADEVIEVRMPSSAIRAELFMTENKPVLYRKRISCTPEGVPIEWSQNYDQAEQHKYYVHMEKSSKK